MLQQIVCKFITGYCPTWLQLLACTATPTTCAQVTWYCHTIAGDESYSPCLRHKVVQLWWL